MRHLYAAHGATLPRLKRSHAVYRRSRPGPRRSAVRYDSRNLSTCQLRRAERLFCHLARRCSELSIIEVMRYPLLAYPEDVRAGRSVEGMEHHIQDGAPA
jgi:hypothetical protein